MRTNPLVRKLDAMVELADEDRADVEALCAQDVRQVEAKHDISPDGASPKNVHLVLQGWAAQYKILPNGSRQITALLIPGDFCNLHLAVLDKMDHGLVALTRCMVAHLDSEKLDQITTERTALTKGLWRMALADQAVLRQWIINAGRRTAVEAVAHILCEMHARMTAIGLTEDGTFDFPLTQEELADAIGMTAVHVNRTLQKLRGDGLVELTGRVLMILDIDGLRRKGEFEAGYLHLRSPMPAANMAA